MPRLDGCEGESEGPELSLPLPSPLVRSMFAFKKPVLVEVLAVFNSMSDDVMYLKFLACS